MLLHNQWVKEITRKIRKLEMNDNLKQHIKICGVWLEQCLRECCSFFFWPPMQPVGSQFPKTGNLHPLHWKCRVLTAGPPEKSWEC